MKSMAVWAAGAIMLLAAQALAGEELRSWDFTGEYRMAGHGFGPRRAGRG